MSGIFISYRRRDAPGSAGRLYDDLCDRFTKDLVFRDVDALAPGVDYEAAIDRFIGSCDAFVAVIGNRWLEVSDDTGARRLDDPDDIVRQEIAIALQADKLVIPVLVEDARMPAPSELPESLRPLSRRNAFSLSDSRWDYDVGILGDRLAEVVDAPPVPRSTTVAPPPPPPGPSPTGPWAPGPNPSAPPAAVPDDGGRRGKLVAAVAGAVVVVVALVAAVVIAGGSGDDDEPTAVVVTSPGVTAAGRTTTTRATVTTTTSTPAPSPIITLTRRSGSPGSTTLLTVGGFQAGETIDVIFGGRTVTSATTDEGGVRKGVLLTVPSELRRNTTVEVTATGRSSKRIARTPFQVT